MRARSRSRSALLVAACVAVAAWLVAADGPLRQWLDGQGTATTRNTDPTASPSAEPAGESGELARAQRARRSGVWVEDRAKVHALLRDDNEGSRHQKFLLILADGGRVLVSHNIDLAPRAPIRIGTLVELRGRFEWNEKGGVVHWTHHDPDGSSPGGWLRVDGTVYR